MQISGPTGMVTSERRTGFAVGLDTATIVQKVANVKEAKTLARGCVVGDQHGGLTFTDAVAAALEARSIAGWQEIQTGSGETWTIILVNR